MSELLPCPFCGGEADISDEGVGTEPERFWAYCENPACFVEGTSAYPTEAEAIAVWNTRAERTCRIVKSALDGQMWVYRHEFACECGQKNLFTSSCEPPKHCPNCGAKVIR